MSDVGWWSVAGALAVLAIVYGVQWVAGHCVANQVLDKLGRPRPTPGFTIMVRSDTTWPYPQISWQKRWKRPASELSAFTWADERPSWDEQAAQLRRSFLRRTQETAEKWRTIFAALLAVFGAVLLVKPSLPQGPQGMGLGLYLCTWAALVLAVQAVAYTGWAAAGLPKILVDVDAESAFIETTLHAAHALARLRVGLVCGALAALALLGGFAALLAPPG
ncbi:hypothetical protein [Isoptericola sp. NPDC057191]|uniref:hypothetical protein n=1 Tax=Isoptericola sp. NPDC057191 TaxID=3346041 RepID=UPI0036392061